MAFNTKMAIHDDWMMGYPDDLGNFEYGDESKLPAGWCPPTAIKLDDNPL
jgi:hypothetical protein